MKTILTLTILFIGLTTSAQNAIIGITSTKALEAEAYQNWYLKGYESYKPADKTVKKLKRIFKKNDFKVEVYFGTWCSDSQREIPKVIKLLKEAKFDMNALTLIGVGRDKIVPDVSEEERKTLNITNVPTIVIYENGNEINRFVEYAQETLAEDLLMIFSQKPYKHSYQF